MKSLYKYVIFSVLAISVHPVYAAISPPEKPLEVGVVPYLSARVLVSSYEPLRLYLEQSLHRPVILYTATGFKQFLLNSQRGDYDLIISSSHFARLLQKENKFTPLVRYSKGGHGLILTTLGSKIHTIQDLAGKTIAVPDKLSLASISCLNYLSKKGLNTSNLHFLLVPSFASAILSVQKGEADAAISASGALAQMPIEIRESVRKVVDTGEFISLVFLSHPRLDKQFSSQLTRTLLQFGNQSDVGKQFFSKNGFGTVIPVTEKEMSLQDAYLPETKKLLREAH